MAGWLTAIYTMIRFSPNLDGSNCIMMRIRVVFSVWQSLNVLRGAHRLSAKEVLSGQEKLLPEYTMILASGGGFIVQQMNPVCKTGCEVWEQCPEIRVDEVDEGEKTKREEQCRVG
jgi:hypothetical protein